MSRQNTRGFTWTLSSASPDVLNPDCKGHKIATQWTVLVIYSLDGSTLDGPAVLRVNIADGSVAFIESP